MRRKVIHVSNEAHTLAKAYCDKNGMRMSVFVAGLIDKHVNDPGPPPITKTIRRVRVVSPLKEVIAANKRKEEQLTTCLRCNDWFPISTIQKGRCKDKYACGIRRENDRMTMKSLGLRLD